MVSVIIPMYNEEAILEETLSGLSRELRGRDLILVDGGSEDRTVEIAGRFGRVLQSARGRGLQMNTGAAAATGDLLLFLHSDCRLEAGALDVLEAALSGKGYVGGCFRQRIDACGWDFRLIEIMIRLRTARRFFYGDQAIFVQRSTFFALGGYPDLPLMEDVIFSKRLRRAGRTLVLDKSVYTSARRWQRLGTFRTTLINAWIRLQFACGVSPVRLAKTYYGK
ncbi:MAG: TIGR04283 family arsenosugar biosynthesis glycosyltransferase [Planctomycetes bacterium]|nr:TIGR04283 family arsenosugar biosynthesis glycosyltransferase [Planctomycetota bacterium]